MSKSIKRTKGRRHTVGQTVLSYILTVLGINIALLLLVVLADWICHQFTWQQSNPIYQLLKHIQDNCYVYIGVIILGDWIAITYWYMAKPLRHLTEILAASKQLATSNETPIILSNDLKDVQDEMNGFREQALRNASLAKEAEQRKNDLIIYLAHDLKTPLTSVIGYLTLLHDEPLISQKTRARYTGIALDKAKRLEDLINEFFDITRFNLTTLTLELERVNLSRMLEQVTYEFNPILADKALTWQLELMPDVEILCDSDKLARVFDNLIRNAINYSYNKTTLFLSMHTENDTVHIMIKNHGKTIPPDKLDRIFEQFFRLDSSRSSASGGAGLGLAISKEIIKLHGGSIQVASELETITFTVTLPMNCHKIV